MCDTMVSTPKSSAEGAMIVGKNSDREPNEGQNITFVSASDHAAGSKVRCTYIEIPQVRHTYAALLSRPFWMFGAEMGVNEYGVAIGNEAVFTKEKYHRKNNALLGMDLLRLALERSQNAREAIDVVTQLLDAYGQGSIHTMGGTKYYHNSFIIADPLEAYILETAGVHWVYKKVDDIASISNCLTIEDVYDKASFDQVRHPDASSRKKADSPINFNRNFSDSVFTHFARGRIRKSYSYNILNEKKGTVTSSDIMKILRSHNVPEPYQPGYRPMERICLHAGGLISSQTAGSMVTVLKKGRLPLVYFTGTSAPCMSIYKPHTISNNQNKLSYNQLNSISPFGGYDIYGTATDKWDHKSLWWSGEKIHRRVLMNYSSLMPILQSIRNVAESKVIGLVEKKWKTGNKTDFITACRNNAEELVLLNNTISDIIQNEYIKLKYKKDVPWWFAIQWCRINAKAGFIIED